MSLLRIYRAVISDRQAVEFFHLQFIRLLWSGRDTNRFAIQGGCNLRFFFESARYSDDIDLDVNGLPVDTLREKVTKILERSALAQPLKSRGIALRETRMPKQTETIQRWKLALSLEGRGLPLHTKIEFSRRLTPEKAVVEAVDAGVLADYGLMPLLAPHYPLSPAIRQKVGALVGRTVVQARDVYDLGVLLARAGGATDALEPIRAQLEKAIERVREVSYADYRSQVISYLKPEYAESFGSRGWWETLRAEVLATLEKARQ